MKTIMMKIFNFFQMLYDGKEEFGKRIKWIFVVMVILILGYLIVNIVVDDIKYWDERVTEKAVVEEKEISPIPSAPERDYGISEYTKVAENSQFILSADLTNGRINVEEKNTGKIWYSNPTEIEEDTILTVKSQGMSQLLITCLVKDEVAKRKVDSYGKSVKLGGMESELIDNGVKFVFSFPDMGVRIPVQYVLCEEGFVAEIISEEIEELWTEEYLLLEVELLPYFGAGSLEDDGYLFVPDGSGALIYFNNNKQKYTTYSGAVYGNDPTFTFSKAAGLTESVTLPVFGMKSNDNAFVAVIESGDSNGIIYATTSQKSSSYNCVYSSVVYRQYTNTAKTTYTVAPDIDYTELLLKEDNYSVKYMFLEENADYVGMSQQYLHYLSENGKVNASTLAGENYLFLDIYGAVSIEKNVLGRKVPVVTALTTYNDVCNIVKELKSFGVNKIIINYIGALDGGFEKQIWNNVKHEQCLGTKKEFHDMIDYLNSEDVLLFIESDPVDVYENDSNYKYSKDSSKTFFESYVFEYDYLLNNNEAIQESRWKLLTPRRVAEQMKKFVSSAEGQGIKGITFYGVGNKLHSDLNEGKNYATRLQSMNYLNEALDEVKEQTDCIMVHGGNSYVLPYVDVVTDIPTGSSEYDMLDQNIPFYQLALQENILLASKPHNESSNYNDSIMKAIESGSCLKFNIVAADATLLVGTEYDDLAKFSYENWREIIVDAYLKKQEIHEAVKGEKIVGYKPLMEDVIITEYESGKAIIINYSDDSYQYKNYEIESNEICLVEEM